MSQSWYPLTFYPVYKDYIWGGDRIARQYGREETPARCAESWECSTRPEGMSIVRNGPLAGRTLRELAETDPSGFLGSMVSGADFPLLIKLIDARQRLSVQVHPDDASAHVVGGEAKTEAWYILAAEPDACLYCGLQPGVTPEALRQAIDSGRPEMVTRLLREQRVAAGDVIFVPGGRVHAIGAGVMLLEVQQNSNTTYRLYDWGRVGSDGKPRELHIEQAFMVIDWEDTGRGVGKTFPRDKPPASDDWLHPRVTCPWFVLDEVHLKEMTAVRNDGASFHVWFAVDGGMKVAGGSGSVSCAAGGTVMMPAAIANYTVSPSNGQACRMVRIRLNVHG